MKNRINKFLVKAMTLLVLSLPFCLVLGSCFLGYRAIIDASRTYVLTPLLMGPQGPQAVGQMLVTNVVHSHDGGLCFVEVSNDQRACLKFPMYDLTETSVK